MSTKFNYILEKLSLKEAGLDTRAGHVKDEESFIPIPKLDHKLTEYVIHHHESKRAPVHEDIRMLFDGKAVSFAAPKGMPVDKLKKRWIRTPDHEKDFMAWQGTIKPGEYGAGEVSILDKGKMCVTTGNGRIKILIPEGPFAGNFTIVKTNQDHLAFKRAEPSYYWEEKGKQYLTKVPEHLWDDPKVIASHKIDGANSIWHICEDGRAGIVSSRKSVDGSLIIYNNKIPHLSDIVFPKRYIGTTFRAELHLPQLGSFSQLAGILNSGVLKALETQEKTGKIHAAPFDVININNKKTDITYGEKLDFLKGIETVLQSPYIRVPSYTNDNKKDFLKKMLSSGQEGIILSREDEKGKHKLYKVKKNVEYTLKIIGATEGNGRLKGSAIGNFLLADKAGNLVCSVGSGLTDKIRRSAYQDFDQYKGKLVRISAMEASNLFSLRHPVFKGIEVDSNEADEVTPNSNEKILDFLNKFNFPG